MSSSKLITKESLTAFERWELPAVGAAARPHSEELSIEAVPDLLSAEKLEEIRQAAYHEGFEQGRHEGLQSGQQESQARAQRLSQILTALAEPLREVDEQVEQELIALAIAIARQLIRRELKLDPGEIVAVVRESLAVLPSHAQRVQVFLHPEDAAVIREKLAIHENDERAWRLVEDPALTRGGCKVTSDHSRIDATVEKRMAAAIARVLGGEREDDRNG
jgi:flagellar assembly protein FliH